MLGHHIVVYDVTDDKRRTRLRKRLKDFGLPVQYSVFEAQLAPPDLVRLRHALLEIIDSRHDSVIIFFLCARCAKQVQRLGTAPDPFVSSTIVL